MRDIYKMKKANENGFSVIRLIQLDVLIDSYDWFDELIIPAGEKSNVPLFEMHRVKVDWTDTLVRLFVLKQEYREVLVKERHNKRKQ